MWIAFGPFSTISIPSGRIPDPASKISRLPWCKTSKHVVFPPYLTVCGPGEGIDPRVPQQRTVTAEASSVLRAGEVAVRLTGSKGWSSREWGRFTRRAVQPMYTAEALICEDLADPDGPGRFIGYRLLRIPRRT